MSAQLQVHVDMISNMCSYHIINLNVYIGYTGKYCSYLYGRTYLNRGSCTKLEHCVSSFNTQTGDCPGPGNQCEPGWMGPGCQYGR